MSDKPDLTRVSDETRAAEAKEAMMPADAGAEPTPEEAAAAERQTVDPEVAKAQKESTERGAKAKGEGRIG